MAIPTLTIFGPTVPDFGFGPLAAGSLTAGHPALGAASYRLVADTDGKWPYLEDVTADFMYLRLHGDKELYASGYTEAALDRWADRIRAWSDGREPRDAQRAAGAARRAKSRDVFCYFDNDIKVRAPFDADRLMHKLGLARADLEFRFPHRRVLRNIRPVAPLPPFRWRFPRAAAVKKPARG